MNGHHIIIFDGVCNFCNTSVNFIIKRDKKKLFKFTPMQSQLAKELIKKFGARNIGFDTFLLIKNETIYYRTNAALEITRNLVGYWYFLRIFILIPRPIRDYFYRLFARNRYKIFGRRNSCIIPDKEIMDRFL